MNEERLVISAVVIVLDGIRFLPDCLFTLVNDLEGFNYELIVVDNGSSDGSVGFVKEQHPSARLIENGRNLGFARAVNQGVEAAKGENLYILNQDLRFHPGTANGLLKRLNSDESIGLIGPAFVGFDGRLQKSVRAFPTYRHVFYRALFLDRIFSTHREFSHWRMGWFDHQREMFVDQPMGAAMLIPRRVIDKVGLMDESFPILFNDVDYCRRISEAGYKLLYYPEVTVEHYVGATTGRWPYRMKAISHLAMYRYLRKYARWYEYPALWLCALLLLIGLVPSMAGRFIRTLFTSKAPSS